MQESRWENEAMFLLKLVRKLFRQIKSDLTPNQIALGVFLGTLLGLTPSGLHWIPILFLAFLFNCSMGMVLLCWGLFKPIFLLLAPAAFRVGLGLLSGRDGFFPALVQWLSETPFLAWLGYERYLVLGAYVLAIPTAFALAVVARVSVRGYRERVAPKIAAAAWYQKIMKVGILRFGAGFLFGKDKEPVERKKRFLLLRPFRAYMLAAIPALCIALVVGAGFYAQFAVKDLAAPAVSKALGVTCTFGDVAYAFFGQEFSFSNFQLPDPSDTKRDMVRIGGFEADLGFLDLLSKRFRVEKLVIRDAAFHVARKTDGSLNVTDLPAAKPDTKASEGEQAAWKEFVDGLMGKGREADWASIWKQYQAYRQKKSEAKQKAEDSAKAKPEPLKLDYDPDARWEPARRIPLVRVDHIEIENLALALEDQASEKGGLPSLSRLNAKGTQLSSMPGWNRQPVRFEGAGTFAGDAAGSLTFRIAYLPEKTEADIQVAKLPLTDFKPLYEKSLPVDVVQGVTTLDAKGEVAAGTIDSAVNLRIDGLKIAARPGSPGILGLDAQTSGYAIQGINAYGEKLPVVVGVAVVGPASDPSIQGKVPFLDIAKKGLEMLGKQELQKYIDTIGGEIARVRQAGLEKIVPLQEGFKAVQTESLEALKKGDVKGVQEAIQKGKADLKPEDAKDLKEEAQKKLEGAKDALDLFRKKK